MPVTQSATREWTVAYYGSHDGSNFTIRLDEDAAAERWKNEGSSDQVQLSLEVDVGDIPVVRSGVPREGRILPENEESFPRGADLASKQHLKDFILWNMKTYPSKKFALVVSSHGGGMIGVITDADHRGRMMTIQEFRDALLEAKKETGRGVDLLVFNCCLMGQEEVFHALKDTAGDMVASSQSVWGELSLHKLLKGLKERPDLTPEEAARRLVSSQPKGIIVPPATDTLLHAKGGKTQEEILSRLDSVAASLLNDLKQKRIAVADLRNAARHAPGARVNGSDLLPRKAVASAVIGAIGGSLFGPIGAVLPLIPVIAHGYSRIADELTMRRLGYRNLDGVLSEFGKLQIGEESKKVIMETRDFLSQSFSDSRGKGPHVYLAPGSPKAQARLDLLFQKFPLSQGSWGAMVSMINGKRENRASHDSPVESGASHDSPVESGASHDSPVES